MESNIFFSQWLEIMNLELYSEFGLCGLIKMRQAYADNHLDQQLANIVARECATDKLESVEKLLQDNETTIQESIYQVAQFFLLVLFFALTDF
jgi:hypothetical protein